MKYTSVSLWKLFTAALAIVVTGLALTLSAPQSEAKKKISFKPFVKYGIGGAKYNCVMKRTRYMFYNKKKGKMGRKVIRVCERVK